MTDTSDTKHHPPTYRWEPLPWPERRRRMSAAAGGVHSSLFPSPRSVRLPLGITIVWLAGPDDNVLIQARGWRWIFPAHVTLIDAILTINGRPPRKS